MFSRWHSRTLSIVKLRPDKTNDVSLPAPKGKYHEETADYCLRHLCPVPVNVWLTHGHEYAFEQFSKSLYSIDRPGYHAKRLPGAP
jgi:hypothetical protein